MDNSVQEKFDAYPEDARRQLLRIREAIFAVAELHKTGEVTETLKWGEPSYLVKRGSTIRIDWKAKSPDKVSVFFNCNTSLVETFRELFPHALEFVGNREIALPLGKPLPVEELKTCLSLALRYHDLKNLPMLGI